MLMRSVKLYDQSIEEVEKQPFIHIGAVNDGGVEHNLPKRRIYV